MTDIQQEVGTCERCWGKAFTAAYGIGSKTQAGEYERMVASCACTPAQRRGVTDSFAEGYAARDKEIEELRAKLASMREPIWMLREEHEREIEELRAKLEEVPVVEIRTSIEYALSLPSDYEELKAAETVVRWLATVTK